MARACFVRAAHRPSALRAELHVSHARSQVTDNHYQPFLMRKEPGPRVFDTLGDRLALADTDMEFFSMIVSQVCESADARTQRTTDAGLT